MKYLICFLLAFCIAYGNDIQKKQHKSCIKLKKINLSNNFTVSPSVQKELSKKHINKCISKNMIKNMINDLSNHFFKNGYITTKAYLKKQSIKNGVLDIIILNGKIERVVNKKTNKTDSYLKTAFLGQSKNILNLRKLEGSLEVINRVPSMNAEFKIMPGNKVGKSIILVDMKETKPYILTVGVSGDSSLLDKDKDLTASFSYDNLFNINDIISYQYNSELIQKKYQGSDGNEISYSFPLGEYIFNLSYANTSYKQGVNGENSTYLSNGETKTYIAKLSKNLFRNQNNKLDASFEIRNKHTKNYFESQLLDVSSYITTTFRTNINHTIYKKWGQVNTIVSYENGKPWFGARTDSEHETQEVLGFKKYILSSNLQTEFLNFFKLNSNFSMQYSKDKLFSDNRLTLGSKHTVRGHKSTIYGNSGWYINNTISKDFNFNTSNKLINNLSFNIGFDYGEIRCQKNTSIQCGKISGASVGLNTNSKNLSTDISWNRPLKNLKGLEDKDYVEYNMHLKF
jgi:hemolysin activation/secretion protein